MRLTRTLILPAAVLAAGCINFETVVKVKPDGSGTMVQTMTMNPQAMEGMMQAMAKQMGGEVKKSDKPAKKQVPGTSEAEAKAKVADLGEGVTYVSSVPIERPDAVGATMTFAFKDIGKLKVNPKPDKPGGPPAAGATPDDKVAFRLSKGPGGNSLLTVTMGEMKREGAKAGPASPPPATGPEEVEMMKQMFKGMRVALAVEVDGKVVKTNSPYLEGNRVTILDFDFEKLMENKDFKSLDPIFEGSLEDARKALKGVKGVKMNLEPEVRIEFK